MSAFEKLEETVHRPRKPGSTDHPQLSQLVGNDGVLLPSKLKYVLMKLASQEIIRNVVLMRSNAAS